MVSGCCFCCRDGGVSLDDSAILQSQTQNINFKILCTLLNTCIKIFYIYIYIKDSRKYMHIHTYIYRDKERKSLQIGGMMVVLIVSEERRRRRRKKTKFQVAVPPHDDQSGF